MRPSYSLTVLLALLLSAGTGAAVDEVTGVAFDSGGILTWNADAGNLYHVYRGGLAALPDYGSCLVGSTPGGSASTPDLPAVGEGFFYLITENDEVEEGTAGQATDTTERIPTPRCIVARRLFEPVADGDTGDGVIDGDHPLRNPSVMTRHTRRETTGVFLHTGEFFLTAGDLTIPGRRMDWSFRRTYRSQVNYDGPLGHNWDFNLNARLRPLGSDVRFLDGAGRDEHFFRIDSTRFSSPAGRYSVLIGNPDGSFTLRSPDGMLRNFHGFDGSNLQGALVSVENRFGDRMSMAYDAQGLLTTTTDSLGRAVDLSYGADGRVTEITDFAGRSWAYGYDANGDMVTARSPIVVGTPNGNDFPAGKTTAYSYSSGFADPRLNHCMLTITNPNEQAAGPPWSRIMYFTDTAPSFDQGRVDTWDLGKGTNASGVPAGGTIQFSYESLNAGVPPDPVMPRRRTTVIDRNGNQRRYVHNHAGNRIEQTLFTNREVRPGEPDYTTSYDYNDDGELTVVNHPEGNQTTYSYDTPGLDRYREGNLLESRRTADSLASGGRGDGHGAEVNDLVTTYEYDPVYNLLQRSIDPRGNDAGYVPQNGGAHSANRYSTEMTYCHQEGDPATNGLNAYAARFGIDLTGFVSNLGDVNGDATTDRIYGTPIREVRPAVTLDAASNQAAIEGDTSQDSETLHIYNPFAQRVQTVDAEGNVHLFDYHPENDPDGDGTPTTTPPDGRSLDGTTGGYLAGARVDTASGAGRNNGTDPTPADIELSYSYDAVGNRTHVVDGRGVLTRYVRNALNEVVELRRGAATADASGPDGDAATGRGETGLSAPGFRVRHEFDANGNLVARKFEDRNQDHGAGTEAEECLIWDIDDGTVHSDVEDSTGSQLRTTFRYDANRNLTEIVRPEGNSDQRSYDERDLLHTATSGATGLRGGTPAIETFEYDSNGNLTQTIDGRGNPTDLEYDGHDRLTRVVDQVGNTIDRFHDPAGRIVRTLHRGPVGGPTPADRSGTTNVDLRSVEQLWDEQQRLFRVDFDLFVPAGAAPGRVPLLGEGPLVPGDGAVNASYEYDRLGRPTFSTRDTGATSQTGYDGAGRVISTVDSDGSSTDFTWDAQDNMIESAETELSSSPGPAAELFLTTHFYDPLGRRVQVVDNLGQTTRHVYSSLDAVIKTSDANGPAGPTIGRRSAAGSGLTIGTNLHGNVTDQTWDAAGRLLRTDRILTVSGLGDGTPTPAPNSADPNNPDGMNSVIYGWDGNSLKTSWQDDQGNTTSQSYDNHDRLLTRTFDDGTATGFVYDTAHNLSQKTDPNGNVLTYSHDPANRTTLLSINRATGVEGTTQQTFEYDGLNRVTRAIDNNEPLDTGDDAEVRTVYDSLNRVVEEKQIYGTGPLAEKLVDLHWNADALITDLIYPSGRQIAYGYDAADRLVSVGDTVRSETAGFQWFGFGRLHTRSYGNGVRMTMLDDAGTVDEGFDAVRRIIRMRHLDGADDLLAGFEHGYDRVGSRGHELRLHDEDAASGGFRGELWSFDSHDRLTDLQEGTLDAALSLVGPAADAQSWALDGSGNWAQMTRNGTTYGFSVNNLNEYDEPQSGGTRTDDGLPDDAYDDVATPTADGENRAHDSNGNRTEDARLVYSFDFNNRLVRVTELGSSAPIAEYDYDPSDRRIFRDVTNSGGLNETRRYLYVPDESQLSCSCTAHCQMVTILGNQSGGDHGAGNTSPSGCYDAAAAVCKGKGMHVGSATCKN